MINDLVLAFEFVSAVIIGIATYALGTNRWARWEREGLVSRLHSLRTHVVNYWFGESPGKETKPLRDMVLALEIGPRLTDEIRKWFTASEFEQKMRDVPSLPDKQSNVIEGQQAILHYSLPDKNWWWRLDKLFREAQSIYKLNQHNFTTLAEDQLKTSATGQNRRTVYPDLTEPQFEEGIHRFSVVRDEVRSIITRLYFMRLKVWLMALLAVISSFSAFILLSDRIVGPNTYGQWLQPFGFAIGIVAAFALLYPIIGWALHLWTGNFEWSTANLLTELVRDLLMLAIVGFGLFILVNSLPTFVVPDLQGWLSSSWDSVVVRFLIIGGASVLVLLLTEHAVTFVMERLSRRFKFAYDDMFSAVIRFFVMIYVVLVASGAFILGFHSQLGITTPDTIVIVYTVIGALITGAVGYASRDSIESFFAGLMLRVSPTFEVGDRIILEDMADKRICDVREIGLRTVRLYDIMSNTEMFVPNGKLSSMVVTNVSRPDLELRIQIPVMIRAISDPNTGEDSLTIAERVLMDVAYTEPEVDQTAISDKEAIGLKRISIESAWQKLVENHLDVTTAVLTTMENASSHPREAGSLMEDAKNRMKTAREQYRTAAERKDEPKKFESIDAILASYGELRRIVDTIAESKAWLRDDEYIRAMKDELNKEPVVYSTFGVSGNAEYITATLAAFATDLQRRFEVENRLNKAILERLEPLGLLLGEQPMAAEK